MDVDAPCLHELDRVDDATANLILQLHNRDVEELLLYMLAKAKAEMNNLQMLISP